MGWYNMVKEDIKNLDAAINFFEGEVTGARKECFLRGSLEKAASDLPGQVEYRYRQLQEIEAILKFLEINLSKIKAKHFRTYLEGYPKTLSSREAERYSEGEEEVVDFEVKVNDTAYIRNQYLAIMKALDQKQWQISNIVKLRVVGLEDASV